MASRSIVNSTSRGGSSDATSHVVTHLARLIPRCNSPYYTSNQTRTAHSAALMLVGAQSHTCLVAAFSCSLPFLFLSHTWVVGCRGWCAGPDASSRARITHSAAWTLVRSRAPRSQSHTWVAVAAGGALGPTLPGGPSAPQPGLKPMLRMNLSSSAHSVYEIECRRAACRRAEYEPE